MVANCALLDGDTRQIVAIFIGLPSVAYELASTKDGDGEITPLSRGVSHLQHAMVGTSIVGMSCMLADGAHSSSRLWDTMSGQQTLVTSLPPDRWSSVCAKENAPVDVLVGAFLETVSVSFPELSEVDKPDLHLELMLSMANESLCDAAWANDCGRKIGAVTAAETLDFAVPTFSWLVSRLVAQALRTEGPSTNIEAGCASSYLATAHALSLLNNGECEAALVVGASLMLKPLSSVALLKMGGLSLSGRMRPLDTSADGMVRGEAGAAIVLQRVSDQQTSYATVLAASATITSTDFPLGFADADAMGQACKQAMACSSSAEPGSIAFTHMHAMGNPSCDIPEAQAVWDAIGRFKPSGDKLKLASHKGSFGHTVAPSGLVAIITSALILQNRSVAVWAGTTNPVKEVDSMHLPTHKQAPLPLDGSLLASISGTSNSGDNIHILLAGELAHRSVPLWTGTTDRVKEVGSMDLASLEQASPPLDGILSASLSGTSNISAGRVESKQESTPSR